MSSGHRLGHSSLAERLPPLNNVAVVLCCLSKTVYVLVARTGRWEVIIYRRWTRPSLKLYSIMYSHWSILWRKTSVLHCVLVGWRPAGQLAVRKPKRFDGRQRARFVQELSWWICFTLRVLLESFTGEGVFFLMLFLQAAPAEGP